MKERTGIKNAFIIQGLNSFISGTIFILLPLLMLERGISIELMGLVFAVLPLVSQTNRLIFGITSDYIGRKKFYWLNGLINLVHLIVYYFAHSPLGFLIGKASEGLRNASLWSVNRAYFVDHSKKRKEMLVKMRGAGSIFNATGILLAGFLIANLHYNTTLILLMGLSLFIFPNVKRLKDKNKQKISILKVFAALKLNNKKKRFKNFFILFFILGFSIGFTSGYIFPLFLREMKMGVEEIGLLLGIKILFGGISLYALHSIEDSRKKVLLGGLLYSLLLVIIPFSSPTFLPLIVILLGIIGGVAEAGHEGIFLEVANHNSLAGDIGILMVGTHVGMSVTQAISGFAITTFGFPLLFLTSAILYTLFSLIAYHNMEPIVRLDKLC
jgi:MFS family permease